MHNLLLYAIYHGLLTIDFLATKYTNDKLANESFKNDVRLADLDLFTIKNIFKLISY